MGVSQQSLSTAVPPFHTTTHHTPHTTTHVPQFPAPVPMFSHAGWAPPSTVAPHRPQAPQPPHFATPQVAPPLRTPESQPSFPGEFPGIPRRFIEQIQRGESINFDALYTAIVYGSTATPAFQLVMDENPVGEYPVMSFVQNTRARTRIMDFTGWVRTWNVYMSVAGTFRPHLLPQMGQYFQIITRYASLVPARFWLAYDRSFRQKMANNQIPSWGSLDTELYDVFLRGAPSLPSVNAESNVARVSSSDSASRPAASTRGASGGCYHCGRHGHYVRYCPDAQRNAPRTQQRSTQPTHTTTSTTVTTSSTRTPPAAQPFRAPQRSSSASSVCFAWNNGNQCPPGCRREHRCIICNGLHPRDSCPHATSG